MDEIVWIRPAGYDPAVQPGTILCPEPGLPEFRVVARRPVVMMFHAGPSWDIRPFTQLTLRLVEPEMAPALSTGRSIPASRADPDPTPAQTMPVR